MPPTPSDTFNFTTLTNLSVNPKIQDTWHGPMIKLMPPRACILQGHHDVHKATMTHKTFLRPILTRQLVCVALLEHIDLAHLAPTFDTMSKNHFLSAIGPSHTHVRLISRNGIRKV
jgi:hypothetical protein